MLLEMWNRNLTDQVSRADDAEPMDFSFIPKLESAILTTLGFQNAKIRRVALKVINIHTHISIYSKY